MRVLDEEQEITDAAGSAILDERALKRERLSIRYEPKAADFYTTLGSQCSNALFTRDMN